MILVVVGDENTIARLDDYKDMLRRLGDPRITSAAEAERIIGNAKPIYWATGAIHSPETGSPEMLMELAYRLAVSENDFVRTIRDSAIVLITPVIEVDGRAKVVDLHMAPRKDPDFSGPPFRSPAARSRLSLSPSARAPMAVTGASGLSRPSKTPGWFSSSWPVAGSWQ